MEPFYEALEMFFWTTKLHLTSISMSGILIYNIFHFWLNFSMSEFCLQIQHNHLSAHYTMQFAVFVFAGNNIFSETFSHHV